MDGRIHGGNIFHHDKGKRLSLLLAEAPKIVKVQVQAQKSEIVLDILLLFQVVVV